MRPTNSSGHKRTRAITVEDGTEVVVVPLLFSVWLGKNATTIQALMKYHLMLLTKLAGVAFVHCLLDLANQFRNRVLRLGGWCVRS